MMQFQSLGKLLTKNQQKMVNGGEWQSNRATCVCDDDSTRFICVKDQNCAAAKVACGNLCYADGVGPAIADPTCSNCA